MIGWELITRVEGEGTLRTKDINGNSCEFNYDYGKVRNTTYNLDGTCFRVFLNDKSQSSALAAYLIDYDDGLKMVLITHGYVTEYVKKGIPEYLIPKISEVLAKKIYSSANIKNCMSYDGEYRVIEATKYWVRMKTIFPNNVLKSTRCDMYFYVPDSLKGTKY